MWAHSTLDVTSTRVDQVHCGAGWEKETVDNSVEKKVRKVSHNYSDVEKTNSLAIRVRSIRKASTFNSAQLRSKGQE